MKNTKRGREYHSSEQSAKAWKAWWDEVKFDEEKQQWYLEFSQKRYDEYYKMIEKNYSKFKELQK